MDLLSTFTDIARQAGFELPPELAAWYRSGVAGTPDGAAMAAVYDFEWLDPEDSQRDIDEWLNPAAQNGNRYFPFAQSGAGDAYCLVRLADGREGVACVWHDDDESRLDHASFADFVAASHLSSFADLSHLDGDADDLAAAVRASLNSSTAALPAPHAEALLAPARQAVTQQPYKTGPKARPTLVPALLPQDDAEARAARFRVPEPVVFGVVAQWEIEA
ncbi:SMI1/KNR4 family protein [Bordetella genomosp. 1]|nr:SMI1/KNR4 family protein [Bordetella genomosp. 1]